MQRWRISNPGDTVRVHAKVVEGDRERTQAFEGVVIKLKRAGSSSNFTVRRIAQSIGIERTFLLYSPRVEKVEVLRRGRGASGQAVLPAGPHRPGSAHHRADAHRDPRHSRLLGAAAPQAFRLSLSFNWCE